jgi:hypothetical protein
MPTLSSLWLPSAVWLVAVGSVAVLLGISSWAGGVTLVLVSATPLLVARQFWSAPEPSLSQAIQRELR